MSMVQRETEALRRIGYRHLEPVAFGYDRSDPMSIWHGHATEALYEIESDAGLLRATVDMYSGRHPDGNTPAFDPDAWEGAKLYLSLPASRDNFRLLARLSRVLLAAHATPLDPMRAAWRFEVPNAALYLFEGEEQRTVVWQAWPCLASRRPGPPASQQRPESHHPEAPQPYQLKPLAQFRRRSPVNASGTDRDDA